MKESVAIAKEADAKKEFSSTKSDKSIHRVRDEPKRYLGSLRSVIEYISRDGGTPSSESIATQLSSMHTAQRATTLLALQQTHGNRYVQRVVSGIQAKLVVGQPGDKYEQEADRVADAVMRMPEPEVQRQVEPEEEELLQTKTLTEKTTPLVQRPVEEEEEEILQTKRGEDVTSEVTQDLESQIQSIQGGGQPLTESDRAFFEPRFGHDFNQVRVHTGAQAAKSARAVNAKAYTMGQDVVFGEGQYAPGTNEGRRLLGHELTHVLQQRSPSVAEHWRLLGSTTSSQTVFGLTISTGAQQKLQRKPVEVTAFNFLGLPVAGGINPTMQRRLSDVAVHLRSRFTSIHGRAPANERELREWVDISTILGWRHRPGSTSKHCSGSAVDVNYRNQPYIVTRTHTGSGTVLGGERAGSHLTAQRQATVEVYDRVMDFVYGCQTADVSARRPGETTASVYRRFRNVSDALATYLSLAFHTNYDEVLRQPIANIESATEAELLAAIPTTERKSEAMAVEDIRQYILSHVWDENAPDDTYHWNWEDSHLAREHYFRMLRDYEHVRIPMVRGNPVARPANTRNPARGFLDMTEEFVVAMCDIGNLRWGIADLGEAESGDTHHFDLGHHGGVIPDCS